jgi:hypothetical protein
MESVSDKPQMILNPATMQYVALLDVLGFANRVTSEFDKTIFQYDELITNLTMLQKDDKLKVTIRIFSDSILVVSPDLISIVQSVTFVQWGALLCDCLLRGGVAHGKHTETTSEGNLFVVSEPLVHAARMEKEVKYPCVALHSSIPLPESMERLRQVPPLMRHILFYNERWIINPFGIMWGRSAADRVRRMKEKNPEYTDKYDWFLGLYEAVFSGAPLIP